MNQGEFAGNWEVRYVLRYNLTIQHRGVIAAKGYIVSAYMKDQ